MSAPLSRDQGDLLAAYGGPWLLARIIIDPDDGISCAKGSACGHLGSHWQWSTDGVGIHAKRWTPPLDQPAPREGRPVELSWPLVKRAVFAMPTRARVAVSVGYRKYHVEHQRTVEPWLPGGRAPFVAPPPQWLRQAVDVLAVLNRRAVEAVTG